RSVANQHPLPKIREELGNQTAICPTRKVNTINIKTTLIDNTLTKESNPTILKTATLETIDRYPRTAIHAYTDGSALETTKKAGAGAYVKYPNNKTHTISEPCGEICNNYQAEAIAINITLASIQNQFQQ